MNDIYTREDISWWRNVCDVIPHHWSATTLLAIQSATEAYLVDLMHDGQFAAIHGKRITLTKKDLRIVQRFCNNADAFELDNTMP